jgi:hypothetical protein
MFPGTFSNIDDVLFFEVSECVPDVLLTTPDSVTELRSGRVWSLPEF